MKKYILLSLAILVPLGAIVFYAFFFSLDDGTTFVGKPCTIYDLTGLDCPGCGGQRMFYHLLRGHLGLAMKSNLLFFFGGPVLIYFYYCCVQVYILKRKEYLRRFVFHPNFVTILIAAIIIFFILRNIPFSPFTYLNSH